MSTHIVIANNLKFSNLLLQRKKTYLFHNFLNINVNDTVIFYQKYPKTGIPFVDDLECLVTSITTDGYSRKRNLIKANLKVIRQIQKNNGN